MRNAPKDSITENMHGLVEWIFFWHGNSRFWVSGVSFPDDAIGHYEQLKPSMRKNQIRLAHLFKARQLVALVQVVTQVTAIGRESIVGFDRRQ